LGDTHEDVLLNVCWFILWTLQLVHRGIVGFAPFAMASPGVLPVTIQSLVVG
jgi:hypothetical protein